MAGHKKYSDTFTGEFDENISNILFSECDFYDEKYDEKTKLRRIILKIINNELTARQKEVIMLYYYKNMKIEQIAEATGVSHQSISKTLSRARVKISNILKYCIR